MWQVCQLKIEARCSIEVKFCALLDHSKLATVSLSVQSSTTRHLVALRFPMPYALTRPPPPGRGGGAYERVGTKSSGKFGLKVNGSVRSNRKSFENSAPPFEVDFFSRLDRSDRNGPFHLTIPTHFQSQDLAVRYLPCTKLRKILITALLRIVNSRCISVTRTSM